MVQSPPAARQARVCFISVVVGLALSGCTAITADAYDWRVNGGDGGTVLDGGATDGGTDDTGCVPLTWYGDSDADGFGAPDVTLEACDQPDGYVDNADDCDDSDASIGSSITFYADDDGDGWGVEDDTVEACIAPAGYTDMPGDCDDSDDAVNPDATETCATEADDDCDGETNVQDADDCVDVYPDGDGDGYGSGDSACWCEAPDGYADLPDDCDDSDDTVNPGAEEICFDGIDNDCDGVGCQLSGTWSDSEADGSMLGSLGSAAGETVALMGDLDGDGLADVGVSAPLYLDSLVRSGAVWLAYGPASGSLDLATDADGMQVGAADGDKAGRALGSVGDVNGDGYREVLIGAPSGDGSAVDSGLLYIVYGPAAGLHSLADADRIVSGSESYLYSGRSVAGLVDATGDGVGDLLSGAVNEDSGGNNAGAAYLLAGPFGGSGEFATDAAATYTGEAADDAAGRVVASAGDVDGDGLTDMLIGAYQNDTGGSNAGAVYLVLGGDSGVISLSDAQARLYGANATDGAGKSVDAAGDVNGDGAADVIIGADGNDETATGAGAAYVVFGPISGSLSLDDADVKLYGEGGSNAAGFAVSTAGDLDGDGAAEILVGAPGAELAAAEGGAVYLFYGPPPGTSGLAAADLVMEGSDGAFGTSISAGQDIDGDGTPDMIIGAPGAAGGDGRAYIFYGGGL